MNIYNSSSPRAVSFGGSNSVLNSRNLGIEIAAAYTHNPPTHAVNMSRRQQHARQSSRLPPIAPRDGPPPPPPPAGPMESAAADSAARSSRTRLPPRSRSGCWTCRTRKVKCDEGRPRCNQCTRLGHVCDYNPRLAFKDETSKIVEKYIGRGRQTQQWDTSQRLTQEAQTSREIDTLPPFSTLTNEEDWEKKAGHRAPGTYYVIANSTSFPPSGETTPGAPRSPLSPTHSRRQSLYGGSTDAASDDGLSRRTANIVLDEDTLILGSVEETSRQTHSSSGSASFLTLQSDQGRGSPGSPVPFEFLPGQDELGISMPVGLPYPVGRYNQQDLRRRHYRTLVRTHMFSTNGNDEASQPDTDDFFEQEAERFPLLGAALDELSAWSLAANGGLQNFDTQERYLEILAALRQQNSEAEVRANGKFLTHALLLVYEISASHRSWPLHLAAMLHIFQIRGKEIAVSYPIFLTWIMYIDCNALLCGNGNGHIADFVLDNKLLSASKNWANMKLPSGLTMPGDSQDSEMVLRAIDWMVTLLDHSRRLGRLSERFRAQSAEVDNLTPGARLAQISSWHQESASICVSLEQTWHTAYAGMANVMQNTAGSSELLTTVIETSWFLYHSLQIYGRTSMWPTQRMEKGYAHDQATVAQSCTSILQRCENLLVRGDSTRRAMVFPLFLSGFFSQNPSEKGLSLELLYLMEQASIGNNTRATRRWLQRLYGEQAAAQERGMIFAVDWISKIQEQDFCIIHCGY